MNDKSTVPWRDLWLIPAAFFLALGVIYWTKRDELPSAGGTVRMDTKMDTVNRAPNDSLGTTPETALLHDALNVRPDTLRQDGDQTILDEPHGSMERATQAAERAALAAAEALENFTPMTDPG